MGIYTTDQPLAYRRYLWFTGVTAAPIAMLGALQLNYFTIYATDELLLAPAVVGTLFAIARIYDGITDLAIGWWSDQRTGPGGRRRPFLLASALAFMVLPLMWLPPASLEGWSLILAFAIALILFESFSTLYNVPFIALGIEVARNPQERSFVVVLDRAIGLIGLVAGLGLMQYLIDSDNARQTIVPFILALSGLLFVSTIALGWRLRELPMEQKRSESPPLAMLKQMFAIRAYRQFMVVICAEIFCYASIGFGAVYVMEYVVEAPEFTLYVFLTYFLLQYLCPFAWFRMIARVGLIGVWIRGQCIWVAAFVTFPLVFVVGLPAFWLMAALGGIASAAGICAGRAVLGDIVDYDAEQSGRQRQGIYTTTFWLAGKIVSAAAVFALGWLLQIAGYTPDTSQRGSVIVAISLSVSALPLAAVIISINMLRQYRFYEETGANDGRLLMEPTAKRAPN